MDHIRLFEAAQSGNIGCLWQLLNEKPTILDTISIFSTESPLHIACSAGHVEFVKEILRLKQEFANQVNQDGFSPMHMAAANGHVEIVRELIKLEGNLCRLVGNRQQTPLHSAASCGRVEVISAMLLNCPGCIEDVTIRRETALHIAVKNHQFEATRVMVDWIREEDKEDVLNMKDEQGNTILHLATWKRQREVIELLLGNGRTSPGLLDVNATNHNGLTALDMLLIVASEAGDREILEILQVAGAKRSARDNSPFDNTSNQSPISNSITVPQSQTDNNIVDYFGFKMNRDSPSETRSVLLIIASLVATATFQVGVNPPGGCWQDTNLNSTDGNIPHSAGLSILGTRHGAAFVFFLLFNSIGFAVSLLMIMFLTKGFPLQLELQVCLGAIYGTYNTAIIYTSPDSIIICAILIAALVPFLPTVWMCVRHKQKTIKEFIGRVSCRTI